MVAISIDLDKVKPLKIFYTLQKSVKSFIIEEKVFLWFNNPILALAPSIFCRYGYFKKMHNQPKN